MVSKPQSMRVFAQGWAVAVNFGSQMKVGPLSLDA